MTAQKQDDKGEELNFENIESKIQISNGNFIKFTGKLDTLYKNGMNLAQLKKQRRSHKNQQSSIKNRYYEIVNKRNDPSSIFNVQEDDTMSLWLDSKDYYCSCPKIKPRRKYLVMTKNNNLLKYFSQAAKVENTDANNSIQLNYDLSDNENKNSTYVLVDTKSKQTSASTGILIDRETFIVEWRTQFARRLRRFVKYFQNGRCP